MTPFAARRTTSSTGPRARSAGVIGVRRRSRTRRRAPTRRSGPRSPRCRSRGRRAARSPTTSPRAGRSRRRSGRRSSSGPPSVGDDEDPLEFAVRRRRPPGVAARARPSGRQATSYALAGQSAGSASGAGAAVAVPQPAEPSSSAPTQTSTSREPGRGRSVISGPPSSGDRRRPEIERRHRGRDPHPASTRRDEPLDVERSRSPSVRVDPAATKSPSHAGDVGPGRGRCRRSASARRPAGRSPGSGMPPTIRTRSSWATASGCGSSTLRPVARSTIVRFGPRGRSSPRGSRRPRTSRSRRSGRRPTEEVRGPPVDRRRTGSSGRR